MKVAILGGGPIALSLAQKLEKIDAEVDVFSQGKSFVFFNTFNSLEAKEWKAQYDEFLKLNKLKNFKVTNVQKELVERYETPGERSRFWSLFRVSCLNKPNDEAQSYQLDFLSKEDAKVIQEGLKKSVDIFFDYDVVVDTDEESFESPPEYGVINESHYKEHLFYNLDIFHHLDQIQKEKKELTVVGQSILIAPLIIELSQWLKDDATRVLNIVHSKSDFSTYLKSFLDEKEYLEIDNLIEAFYKDWRDRCEKYEKDLFEWRSSDKKEKLSMPVEPMPQLRLYQDYSPISFDYLEDQKKMYVSCESANFRDPQKQEVVILSSDQVLMLNDQIGSSLFKRVKMRYDSFGEIVREESGKCLEKGIFLGDRKKVFLSAHFDRVSDQMLSSILSLFQKVS